MSSSQATEEFQREQNWRIVFYLRKTIEDFERITAQLDLDIRSEEERTKNSDPTHIAYSTLAKAARARRENILRSRDELILHLKSIHTALEDYSEEQCAA